MVTLSKIKNTDVHKNTVDRSVITNYINTFRNTFGIHLRNGVGTKITISELSTCVFICISLEVGILDSTTFGRNFNSVQRAFRHYGFIDALVEMGKTEGTYVVLQKNKIALIKDKQVKYWDENSAVFDATEIVQHIVTSKKANGVV